MQIHRADRSVSPCFMRLNAFGYCFGFLFRYVFLYAEEKIHDVENPDPAEDGAGDVEILAKHHKESEAHQKRDGDHNLDLGVPGHTLAFDKGFEVILIQLRSDEPLMQFLRAFAEAEKREHKERKCGKHRKYCSDRSKSYTDKSED